MLGCVRSATPPVTPSVQQPDVPKPSEPGDFARLRTEYGDRKDFSDLCERERPLNHLAELIAQQRWDEILVVSQPWLQKCPVDIDAHLATAIALKELGSPLESQHHVRWFRGLVDSILASGDGRTAQTAFVVISVPEEYSLLRALRMRPTGQSLEPGWIDRLSFVSDKGATGVMYFNPAAHFRRLREPRGGTN